LDDDIRTLCGLEHSVCSGFFRRIDHHFRPRGVRHIAVDLSLESVGLEEGDLMAALMQLPDQAPVVSRRAIPVGRYQARAEKRDLQRSRHGSHATAAVEGLATLTAAVRALGSIAAPSSPQIASNSRTRCAQVCRAPIVWHPCSAIARAYASSARSERRCWRISL